MVVGGANIIAGILRSEYYQDIYNNVHDFKFLNKSEQELDEIIHNYKSKNILLRILNPWSKDKVNYDSAIAIKNMKLLGIEKFPIEAGETTVSTLENTLNSLKKQAKKLLRK